MTTDTLNVMTMTEAARRLGECDNTLRRAIHRADVQGDIYLVEGPKAKKTPLFLEARLPQLKQLLEGKENT